MTQLSPEAQAYKRIFAMLFLLRDDFSFIVRGAKPNEKLKGTDFYKVQKAYYSAVSENFNTVNAMINRLLKVSSGDTSRFIAKEMTSERIKDLHVGIDTLLDIQNVEEVMNVIKTSMVEHE